MMPESIRVLIADDEPLGRRGMEQLLASHEDCHIVASCRNGRDALRALRTSQPDVAFLDIQMPGIDAFAVLRGIDSATPPVVVFVTAHDEYAVRAFEERALDYLLKPVSQERFDRTIQRVRERLQADHALRNGNVRVQSLLVPTPTGELVLDLAEIDWIEAVDYCAGVHARGRRFVIRDSLNSLERRLEPAAFVRVHRSAIVRLDRVRELRVSDGLAELILRDGTVIPVSRRRREQVAALLRGRSPA